MDATLRIKNLSITLERLHRLSGSGWGELCGKVENLLYEEIYKLEKEKEKENQWPRRPATTTLRDPYQDDV